MFDDESLVSTHELDRFPKGWDREAANTAKLLRALPVSQYDFRPDEGGRSLGELARHLAEGDAYVSYGIETGGFVMSAKPPNIERPRTVEALAPRFEEIHQKAVARIRRLRQMISTVRSRSSTAGRSRFATSSGT